MSFTEKLREYSKKHASIVCMGMDPVFDRIPIDGDVETVITEFYSEILSAMVAEKTLPAMVKPNIAFYEQYGFEGLQALKKLIVLYQKAGIMVLLDAKRGDIGKTSAAYARNIFEFFGADAVTISPYMGSDSVSPFIEWCSKGKGVYILTRTSNRGAVDLQDLKVGETPLFMKTAEKVIEWHVDGVGAVVGATYPDELGFVSNHFNRSTKSIPLLIPGVGAQGGSAAEIVKKLRENGNDLRIHRINSSSALNYAYEHENTHDFAGAAVRALKKLNVEIGTLTQ